MKAVAQIACVALTALLAACSGGEDDRNEAAQDNMQAQADMNAVTTGPVLPIGNDAAAPPPAAASEPSSPPAAPRRPSAPDRAPPPPAPPPAPDEHDGHDMNTM